MSYFHHHHHDHLVCVLHFLIYWFIFIIRFFFFFLLCHMACSILVLCSVQFNGSVVSDSLWPHGLQHTRLPTPRACSDSCLSGRWYHPIISSSVVPFSSHLQSSPASRSSPVSWFFASGGQSIGASASASVLPINVQDWFPLECTCWSSLQSKGLSRVFSSTTVQKHQFFGAELSL